MVLLVAIERAAAIVGEEHQDRVLIHSKLLQPGGEAADVLIEAVDHRGVGRHLEILVVLLRGIQFGPRFHVAGARAQRPFGVDESHLELAGITLAAQFVPADAVFAAVFVDFLFGGLQRIVGCVVGDVEEEGLVLLLFHRVGDKTHGVVGVGIGVVEPLLGHREALVVEAEGLVTNEKVRRSAEVSEVVVEAP